MIIKIIGFTLFLVIIFSLALAILMIRTFFYYSLGEDDADFYSEELAALEREAEKKQT